MYKKAMAQAPGDAGVMNNYGCFLQDRGKVAEAEEVLQVVIDILSLTLSRWHTRGCRIYREKCVPRGAQV